MTNAILYRMAQGIPGAVSRESVATIEAQPLAVGTPFYSYGIFGKWSGGAFVPLTAVGDAANVYGLLVRPYPITGLNASDPLGTSVPPTTGVANIMRRGYMTVQVPTGGGTPAPGGLVYFRYASPASPLLVGDIEAAAVGSVTAVVPGAFFMSAADANGNVEIGFNI